MFEIVTLCVIIAVFYLAVRLVAKALAGVSGNRHRSYRQLAARYHGRFENRGMVDPPTVSFGYNGSTVRVGMAPVIAGQPSIPRTRVVVRFGQGLPFRFELIPISRPSPAQTAKGTRPVRSGHPDFDRGFVVHANDPDMARELLQGPSVRQAFEDLRKFAPPAGMLASINPERLLVQVDRNLSVQAGMLEAAVRHALLIHDYLQQSVAARLAEGINIVAAGAAALEDAGPPICKVCGDPIVTVHVVCVSCRTPHHRDCWTFVGECSIFGCQCKQCVSA